jgi:hypothetical protein
MVTYDDRMGTMETYERLLEPVDLSYLQHHWGSAYIIRRDWSAVRRDNQRVIRAAGPEELLDLIRLDSLAEMVPRAR